jgi:alpha/beta superfamily hydrolase
VRAIGPAHTIDVVNESFDFEGPAGHLEAILANPPSPPVAAAVVCHAHPLHGGMMHFKVVFRAAKALQSAGLAVLRFNFRGVGRSQGTYDGGRGEREDARAALDEMARRFPGRPLVVGGFSFGAAVGLHVGADDHRVGAVFVLGCPATFTDPTAVVGQPPPLDAGGKPRLFVQGENDPFGSGNALRALVGPWPERRSVVIVPGANHFFDGRLDEMQGAICTWAETRPWETHETGGTT